MGTPIDKNTELLNTILRNLKPLEDDKVLTVGELREILIQSWKDTRSLLEWDK